MIRVYCKRCEKNTDQTHIHVRMYVCSECGETNYYTAPAGTRGRKPALAPYQEDEVRRLVGEGVRKEKLARKFKVSLPTIYKALKESK